MLVILIRIVVRVLLDVRLLFSSSSFLQVRNRARANLARELFLAHLRASAREQRTRLDRTTTAVRVAAGFVGVVGGARVREQLVEIVGLKEPTLTSVLEYLVG